MAEKDFTSREFGVILEDMNSKLDLLVEGQTSLNQRMDRQEKELVDFKEQTNANFKQVFDYLSRIDEELRDVRSEIKDLRTSLSAKADVDRLEQVERRVKELEVQLAEYRAK